MFKVYIAPQSPNRQERDGFVYELAQAIVKGFKDNKEIEAISPVLVSSGKDKDIAPVKFEYIRDAKQNDCDLYIALQESIINEKSGYMGIYCSKINKQSKDFAKRLDKGMENLLFLDNVHVKESSTNMTIKQFEYENPSIVFYINRQAENEIVNNRIHKNLNSVASVFVDVIIDYHEDVKKAELKASKPYQRGDRFLLNVPDFEVRAYSKLSMATAKSSADYTLGNGYYIVYDWSDGCYNLSNNVHIPGVWVREEDLGLE